MGGAGWFNSMDTTPQLGQVVTVLPPPSQNVGQAGGRQGARRAPGPAATEGVAAGAASTLNLAVYLAWQVRASGGKVLFVDASNLTDPAVGVHLGGQHATVSDLHPREGYDGTADDRGRGSRDRVAETGSITNSDPQSGAGASLAGCSDAVGNDLAAAAGWLIVHRPDLNVDVLLDPSTAGRAPATQGVVTAIASLRGQYDHILVAAPSSPPSAPRVPHVGPVSETEAVTRALVGCADGVIVTATEDHGAAPSETAARAALALAATYRLMPVDSGQRVAVALRCPGPSHAAGSLTRVRSGRGGSDWHRCALSALGGAPAASLCLDGPVRRGGPPALAVTRNDPGLHEDCFTLLSAVLTEPALTEPSPDELRRAARHTLLGQLRRSARPHTLDG